MPQALREDLRVLIKVAKHAASLGKEEYKSLHVKEFRLHLGGKSYNPAQLEKLPYELRPSSLCTSWSDEVVIFFGRFSPLSNNHPSPYVVNDVHYGCVEQHLALARAELAGDEDILDRALSCSNPSDCKGILNSLKDNHTAEWEENCPSILMEALRGKFQQNKHLGDYLRKTQPRHLGEASLDPIWGIGVELTDPKARTRASWSPEISWASPSAWSETCSSKNWVLAYQPLLLVPLHIIHFECLL